jgi:hypothetical protein
VNKEVQALRKWKPVQNGKNRIRVVLKITQPVFGFSRGHLCGPRKRSRCVSPFCTRPQSPGDHSYLEG